MVCPTSLLLFVWQRSSPLGHINLHGCRMIHWGSTMCLSWSWDRAISLPWRWLRRYWCISRCESWSCYLLLSLTSCSNRRLSHCTTRVIAFVSDFGSSGKVRSKSFTSLRRLEQNCFIRSGSSQWISLAMRQKLVAYVDVGWSPWRSLRSLLIIGLP